MNITTRIMSSLVLAALTMVSLQASAENISANAAKSVACNYLKHQTASRSFMSTSPSDLTLVHAEASKAVSGANDFYAFNVKGGGFIIVAGEDRATSVLGYSDKGRIDFNNLPAPLQDLLNGFKKEIEFLQTYKDNDLVPAPAPSLNASSGVEPLIKTTWGQEDPYDWQCPTENGEYCVVGCVATAMAQVMYYWKFPTSSNSINSYSLGGWWGGGTTIPGLPATTFNYNLMLLSYCHWDWDNSVLVQDTYTDEQAQEVAKLGRYCGQAVQMDYSPEGSGAYTSDQLQAMKDFGFSQSAQYVQKNGWYSNTYTTAQWESMIRTELDAGRPILYAANDPSAGGHAFICDGYNSDNKYHFNFGWYGTCDGWYVSTALNMIHRDGDELHFNSGHEMLIGVEPPTYCVINVESVDAASGLLVLGESMNTEALNVRMNTSYNNVNLLFSLLDENNNRVSNSDLIPFDKNTFEQGCTVNGNLSLPSTLESGSYKIALFYAIPNSGRPQLVDTSVGQLQVVGHLAKYNEPFGIQDVTETINYLLNDSYPILNINDVTTLINYLLN